jgi:uncharacterized protein YfbU (UPF0304 family)
MQNEFGCPRESTCRYIIEQLSIQDSFAVVTEAWFTDHVITPGIYKEPR